MSACACDQLCTVGQDCVLRCFYPVGVAAFNFCMPKPLKKHQWTAGGWGTVFAMLHFANLSRLVYEQSHGISLTDE